MANITIGYGVVLILLGVGAYFLSGQASLTALIPSAFGVLFLLFGLLALMENLKKHAMHGASVLALLAIFGTVRGMIGSIALITGGEVARPTATIVQAIVCVLSIVFLGLCVNSFIQARKRRLAGSA